MRRCRALGVLGGMGLALTLPLVMSGCKGKAAEGGEAVEKPAEAKAGKSYKGHSAFMDLLERVHLADIDQQGLYIDFGSPAQAKYTVGDWRSGWGRRGHEGNVTFANVGKRGRFYVHVDQPGAYTMRIRLRPVGTHAMTPYLNGKQLTSVFIEEKAGFRDVDFALPAEQVKRGENEILLTFGGTKVVGKEEVAVAIDSARLMPGAAAGDKYTAPNFETLVAQARVGEEKRRSLVMQRPAKAAWYLEVPAKARLAFGVGLEGQGKAKASVRITPEGGKAKSVFSEEVSGKWRDEFVDLGDYAGKVARIELVAEDQGAGRLAWSTPVVMVPQTPTAEKKAQAKNLVVVLTDTLRADKLRPFNPRTRVKTPALDEVAKEAVVFQNAQSPENWTKPSVASVLTSLYPQTHGARAQEAILPKAALTVAEHLKANGFTTGSFIGNGYVSDRFGFDQGWDKYRNYIREGRNTDASNIYKEAGEWVEANHDKRFFVYIHTIDPHVPYDPGDKYLAMYDARSDYAGQVKPRMTADLLEKAKRNPPAVTFDASDKKRLLALHDGEISQHDEHMGLFVERLKKLGVWDDTLFVFVSDHGEEFEDHGSWGHGHSVYQELLHVPLIFRFPKGIPTGTKVEHTVSSMDIAPTSLLLLGVPPMPTAEGRNLGESMRGAALPEHALAFSDFQDERRVVVAGPWKLVLRGNLTATFFNLKSDPGEKQQLTPNAHPIAARYCRIMQGQFLGSNNRRRWLDAQQGRGTRLEADAVKMDDALRGQLKALGYVH